MTHENILKGLILPLSIKHETIVDGADRPLLSVNFNSLQTPLSPSGRMAFLQLTCELLNDSFTHDKADRILSKIYKQPQTIDWVKLDNDINGNQRHVCHFLNLLTEEEKNNLPQNEKYTTAIKRANKIGGRKYHNKKYGGGIVFHSSNLSKIETTINELITSANQ
jgi:hypothetical protein